MNHDNFAAVAAVQSDATSYLIGYCLGIFTILLIDVLHYRLTKRGSRRR